MALFMISTRKKKKMLKPRPTVKRSELNEKPDPSVSREWNQWRLWAGISPEANQPVSRIGIYTDFT